MTCYEVGTSGKFAGDIFVTLYRNSQSADAIGFLTKVRIFSGLRTVKQTQYIEVDCPS